MRQRMHLLHVNFIYNGAFDRSARSAPADPLLRHSALAQPSKVERIHIGGLQRKFISMDKSVIYRQYRGVFFVNAEKRLPKPEKEQRQKPQHGWEQQARFGRPEDQRTGERLAMVERENGVKRDLSTGTLLPMFLGREGYPHINKERLAAFGRRIAGSHTNTMLLQRSYSGSTGVVHRINRENEYPPHQSLFYNDRGNLRGKTDAAFAGFTGPDSSINRSNMITAGKNASTLMEQVKNPLIYVVHRDSQVQTPGALFRDGGNELHPVFDGRKETYSTARDNNADRRTSDKRVDADLKDDIMGTKEFRKISILADRVYDLIEKRIAVEREWKGL
jgi:hypothetical protein